MSATRRSTKLLELIERCLREGSSIEIDGLGSFELNSHDEVVFEPNGRPRVFLAYAREDRDQVKRLFTALYKAGFEPWMDEEKLLPGQNWPLAIERAIELSDFFLGCFSRRSSARRGYFQSELRFALDYANYVPLEDVFLVPVRLEECQIPRNIAKKVHHVDLFPDWEQGVQKLIRTMQRQRMIHQKRMQRNAKTNEVLKPGN